MRRFATGRAAANRLGAGAAVGALLLAPFGGLVAAPTPTGYDYAPFRAALACLLLVAAAGAGRAAPRPPSAAVAAALAALWAAAGLGRTPNPVGGAAEAWDAASGALALAVFARADGPTRRAAPAAIALSAVVVLLFSAYQTFHLFPRLAPFVEGEARARIESGRAFGWFVSPGVLSGYFAVAALVAADLPPRRRPGLVGLLLAGLLLPRSLSGPVAFLAGLAAVGRRRVRRTIVLSLLVLGAVALARSPDLLDLSRGANPVTLRLGTWAGAVRAWTATPAAFVRGHGPGSFADAYMPRRPAAGDETRRAHAWPIETAVEGGLVGLALWVAVVAGVVRALPNAPPGLRAAAVAFLVHNLVEVSVYDPGLRVLGYALFGLVLAGTEEKPGRGGSPGREG